MNPEVNKKMLAVSGISAIIFAVSLALLGIFELIVMSISSNIDFINAGDRWSADGERFAVITLYTEQGDTLSEDQIGAWARSVDSSLLEASIAPENENARSWAYTYAFEETLNVMGPRASASAQTIAAGGDFFVFHPLEFIYGAPFLNDSSLPNGVVLDEDLAWKLFGAVNIIGMEMTIEETPFTVVGITRRESKNGIYDYTYGERPRMYMSYAGYAKLYGDEPRITMFESAIPNAVRSFAKNIYDGVVKANEETSTVMEASDRFSLQNRYNNMKLLKYSWIRENKIEYPYWENVARVADHRCAIMMIFEVVLAAAAVISMLGSFILLRLSGYSLIDSGKNIYAKIEKKRKRKPINKSKKAIKKKVINSGKHKEVTTNDKK